MTGAALPLYQILDKPGGVRVDEALRRADAALESHRAQAEAALARAIDDLDVLARDPGADKGALYERAAFVLDVAGLFSPPVCRAAHSLCDLLVRMNASGRWDRRAVNVHVAAMRLLLRRSCEKDPAVQTLLSGLGAVVGRHPDPSPA